MADLTVDAASAYDMFETHENDLSAALQVLKDALGTQPPDETIQQMCRAVGNPISTNNPSKNRTVSETIAAFEQPTSVTENSNADNPKSPGTQKTRYLAAISRQTDELSQSMDRWLQLAENPRPDDKSWQIQVATEFAVWKAEYGDAQKFTPPSRLAKLNTRYLASLSLLNLAADDYMRGLDNENAQLIRRANREMDAAATAMRRCSKELNAKH